MLRFGRSLAAPRKEAPWLTQLRLGLTLAGLIVWGYGAHNDVEWLRWVGIGFLALVVLLRFWGAWRRREDIANHDPPDSR
jgi:hypothetical protein